LQGGNGGFGGGGGPSANNYAGGNGGFGAGGAASGAGGGGIGGSSAFGGGKGGDTGGGGGGGAAFGGAIFVRDGGSLTVQDGGIGGGSVNAGLGGDGRGRPNGENGTAAGSALYLGGDSGGAAAGVTYSVSNGNTVVLSDTIAGAGGVTKAGAGTLRLLGTNTYAGGTTVDGGELQVSSDANLGVASGGLRINSGGTFYILNDFTTGRSIDIESPGGPAFYLAGHDLTLNGTISGAGNVGLYEAGGRAFLTGTNTYTGGTTINGGTVQVSSDGNLGAASGGLGFDGGTLQTTSTFSMTRDAYIGSTATFAPASGTTLTQGGVISGPGALIKSDNGTLVLTGANTYASGTTVIGGILKVSSDANLGDPAGGLTLNTGTLNTTASFSSARAIALTAGFTFDVDISTSLTLTGPVSGAAGFAKVGGGTLALTGNNTFGGSVLIANGTLIGNSASLPTNIDNQSVLVFDQSTAGTYTGSLSGAGSLTKTGAGSLNLTGNSSSFTGATSIDQGRLAVNGSLAGSAVSVNNGGILGGNGTIGGVTTNAGGIVAPGNSIGLLNVAGNVLFAPGSFYDVEVNAAGQGDKIVATGTATLNGGTVRVNAASGSYQPATTYTILSATGGVMGAFAGVTSNLAFLDPALSYGANDVTLKLTRNDVAFPDVVVPAQSGLPATGLTPNQRSVAAAIETLGALQPLYNAVVGLDAAGARQAFTQTSGEIHADTPRVAFADSGVLRGAIEDRMLQTAYAPDSDLSHLAPTAYAPDESADLSLFKAAKAGGAVAHPVSDRILTAWGQALGGFGRVSGNANVASLTSSTGGFALGLDVGEAGAWRAGVAGGFTRTSVDVAQRLSSGAVESVHGAIYGGVTLAGWTLNAGLAYARNDIGMSRSASFGSFRGAAGSSYNGATAQAFAEIGYGFTLGGTAVQPYLRAAHQRFARERFDETGNIALAGNNRDQHETTTTLGVRTASRVKVSSEDVMLRLGLGWQHAYGDVRSPATLAFGVGGPAFVVEGLPVDRDSLIASTGLEWRATRLMRLAVDYDSALSHAAQRHAFRGTMMVDF
jgi:outer membrane autotransporter protein